MSVLATVCCQAKKALHKIYQKLEGDGDFKLLVVVPSSATITNKLFSED